MLCASRFGRLFFTVGTVAMGGCASSEHSDQWLQEHALRLSDLPSLRQQAIREIRKENPKYPPSLQLRDTSVVSATDKHGPRLYIWSIAALQGLGPIYEATFPIDGGPPAINSAGYGHITITAKGSKLTPERD